MVSLEIETDSPDSTRHAGWLLAKHLAPGDCIPLSGEMGSGKTCLVQGIAAGLGVPSRYPVTSPSFTIVNRYPGKHMIYHVDLYRLNSKHDIEDLELPEILSEDGIVLIEWPELTIDSLPETSLYVHLSWDMISEFRRRIRFTDTASRFSVFFQELSHAFPRY